MDLKMRITNFKNDALKKIEEAARKGDTTTVISGTKVIEEAERLMRMWQAISDDLNKLERNSSSNSEQNSNQAHTEEISIPVLRKELSPRLKGKILRKNFVQYLEDKGIPLTRKSGSTYKTERGGIVGIAYASEKRPGRWFLGLPIMSYDSIVLLCEKDRGEILRFVIPKDIINKNKERFSQADGNFKFNIVTNADIYQLQIPSSDGIKINPYIDSFEFLK